MRTAKHSAVILILLILTFHGTTQAKNAQDASQDTPGEYREPKITGGIDIGWFSAMHNLSSCGGPWLGIGIGRNWRMRVRMLSDAWYMDYFLPADSVAYDLDFIRSFTFDIEHVGPKLGRTQWPIGLMVGYEWGGHRIRRIAYGPSVWETDAHPIIEPWIGIRSLRGPKMSGLEDILKVFIVVVGYRFPISPDLPGSRWQDLAGPILYVRFNPF